MGLPSHTANFVVLRSRRFNLPGCSTGRLAEGCGASLAGRAFGKLVGRRIGRFGTAGTWRGTCGSFCIGGC